MSARRLFSLMSDPWSTLARDDFPMARSQLRYAREGWVCVTERDKNKRGT